MVTFYRRLPKFNYVKPKSVDEALNLLRENHNESCKVYAGGTDFFPKLKSRLIPTPKIIVDLKGIPDLEYIDYDEKTGLKIGALTTISSVANSSLTKQKFPYPFLKIRISGRFFIIIANIGFRIDISTFNIIRQPHIPIARRTIKIIFQLLFICFRHFVRHVNNKSTEFHFYSCSATGCFS